MRETRKRSPKGTIEHSELKIFVTDSPELPPEEVDQIASLLFQWWREDFEKRDRATDIESLGAKPKKADDERKITTTPEKNG